MIGVSNVGKVVDTNVSALTPGEAFPAISDITSQGSPICKDASNPEISQWKNIEGSMESFGGVLKSLGENISKELPLSQETSAISPNDSAKPESRPIHSVTAPKEAIAFREPSSGEPLRTNQGIAADDQQPVNPNTQKDTLLLQDPFFAKPSKPQSSPVQDANPLPMDGSRQKSPVSDATADSSLAESVPVSGGNLKESPIFANPSKPQSSPVQDANPLLTDGSRQKSPASGATTESSLAESISVSGGNLKESPLDFKSQSREIKVKVSEFEDTVSDHSANSVSAFANPATALPANTQPVISVADVPPQPSYSHLMVAAAEAVVEAMTVSAALSVKGEGEIHIQLKNDILDGSFVKLQAKGDELKIVITPASKIAEEIFVKHQESFQSQLAERVVNWRINVGVVAWGTRSVGSRNSEDNA